MTTAQPNVTAAKPSLPPGERLHFGLLPVETWVAGSDRGGLDRAVLRLALFPDRRATSSTSCVRSRSMRSSRSASCSPSSLAGIDLSVGSVAGLTGVVFASAAGGVHINVLLAMAATVVVGGLIGRGQWPGVDALGIPAFIVTLAGLQGYRGLTMLVSGGMTIAGAAGFAGPLANSAVLGVPTLFLDHAGLRHRLAFPARDHAGSAAICTRSAATSRRRAASASTSDRVTLVAYAVSPRCSRRSAGCCWSRG